MKKVEEQNVQTQIMATAAKFQTKGAASQFKFVASMQAKINKAVSLGCNDRIGQLHRADLEPKYGFKAMTQLDLEEELSAVGSERITKYEKLLKQLKAEDQKETKEKKAVSRYSNHPFRGRPDIKSGFRASNYRPSSPGKEGTKKKMEEFLFSLMPLQYAN